MMRDGSLHHFCAPGSLLVGDVIVLHDGDTLPANSLLISDVTLRVQQPYFGHQLYLDKTMRRVDEVQGESPYDPFLLEGSKVASIEDCFEAKAMVVNVNEMSRKQVEEKSVLLKCALAFLVAFLAAKLLMAVFL